MGKKFFLTALMSLGLVVAAAELRAMPGEGLETLRPEAFEGQPHRAEGAKEHVDYLAQLAKGKKDGGFLGTGKTGSSVETGLTTGRTGQTTDNPIVDVAPAVKGDALAHNADEVAAIREVAQRKIERSGKKKAVTSDELLGQAKLTLMREFHDQIRKALGKDIMDNPAEFRELKSYQALNTFMHRVQLQIARAEDAAELERLRSAMPKVLDQILGVREVLRDYVIQNKAALKKAEMEAKKQIKQSTGKVTKDQKAQQIADAKARVLADAQEVRVEQMKKTYQERNRNIGSKSDAVPRTNDERLQDIDLRVSDLQRARSELYQKKGDSSSRSVKKQLDKKLTQISKELEQLRLERNLINEQKEVDPPAQEIIHGETVLKTADADKVFAKSGNLLGGSRNSPVQVREDLTTTAEPSLQGPQARRETPFISQVAEDLRQLKDQVDPKGVGGKIADDADIRSLNKDLEELATNKLFRTQARRDALKRRITATLERIKQQVQKNSQVAQLGESRAAKHSVPVATIARAGKIPRKRANRTLTRIPADMAVGEVLGGSDGTTPVWKFENNRTDSHVNEKFDETYGEVRDQLRPALRNLNQLQGKQRAKAVKKFREQFDELNKLLENLVQPGLTDKEIDQIKKKIVSIANEINKTAIAMK